MCYTDIDKYYACIFVVVIKCYRVLFELSSFDIGNESGSILM